MKPHRKAACLLGLLLMYLMLGHAAMAFAQQSVPQSEPSNQFADAAAPMKPEELEQLVAPIALYPDNLVSQILMACTYPIEVIEAARWAQKNAKLKGDELAKALESQTWDPSVKSLINVPDVLKMMDEKIDWMTDLGDAVLADQKGVMDAIQRLRAKANAEGNLKSTEQQIVTTVQSESNTEVIVIESSVPDVIYVPQYDPVVVYGSWPYPAYPPYSYYPPGYVVGTAALSFGLGVACGAAWGYAWGNCNWGGSDIDIDVDRNTEFNRNIDRERNSTREKNSNRERNSNNQRSSWNHDSSHRKGQSYRDGQTAQKYGKGNSRGAQSREQYRGRGGAQPSAGGAGGSRGNTPRAGNTGSSRDGAGASTNNRSTGGGALSGSNKSGSSTRASSSRGSSSRSASPSTSSRSSGGRSSGGRSGGSRRGGRR